MPLDLGTFLSISTAYVAIYIIRSVFARLENI